MWSAWRKQMAKKQLTSVQQTSWLLFSGLAEPDECQDQILYCAETLAAEFGMSDTFRAIVGIVPRHPGGRVRISRDGTVDVG
jgi:hypothetical protein